MIGALFGKKQVQQNAPEEPSPQPQASAGNLKPVNVVNVQAKSGQMQRGQENENVELSAPTVEIVNAGEGSTRSPPVVVNLQVNMLQSTTNVVDDDPKPVNAGTDTSSETAVQSVQGNPKPSKFISMKSGFGFGFGAKNSAATAPSTEETEAANAQMIAQITALKTRLVSTLPAGAPPVRCFVEREKGMTGIYPTFRLYLESSESSGERFLLSAKKNSMAKTTYFLISTDMTPTDKESEGAVGKLRGNSNGTQFFFYDCGANPDKTKDVNLMRKELGLLRFPHAGGAQALNMNCWVPGVLPDGTNVVWQPKEEVQSMSRAVEEERGDDLVYLTTKLGDNLDYQGRVSEQSSKNFQLVSNATGTEPVLLFGKSHKDRFSMDVQFPLSLYQAFSICIVILDKTSNKTFKYS